MKEKKFNGLSNDERNEIEILRNKDYAIREIARVIGRSPNTVSYEIKVNSVNGKYVAKKAREKARVSRRSRRYQQFKIEKNKALKDYVVTGLSKHWNPDEISGSMKKTNQPFYVSKSQIYDWLYSSYGQPYCQYLYSKRYRPKRRKARTQSRVMIPDRIPIDKRPVGATNRTRYGHWEGDTMVSGKKTGSVAALSVFVERKGIYGAARLMPNLKPESFTNAGSKVLKNKLALSLTLDNGIENKRHAGITMAIGTKTYFCEPYSSWQKPQVENFNKMIRRYIPKGTDLSTITQAQVDEYLSIINNKPRKSLGYKSAIQLAKEKGVLRK